MNSYIIGAARTPRGRGKAGKGALSHVHPQALLATVLRALPARAGFDPREVDDVIAGAVAQVQEQGANIARNAVLAAGWPDEVSAVSLNRFCGSGLQSIHFAAMGTASGAQQLVVAGGVESMSRLASAPMAAGRTAGTRSCGRGCFRSRRASARPPRDARRDLAAGGGRVRAALPAARGGRDRGPALRAVAGPGARP
ncbi:MAG: hypothetical protein U0325_23015 [Polyangiales bacterium]